MPELETLDDPALLLRAPQAAKLCGTSLRTWRTWDSAGRIPGAIKIANTKLWRRGELEAWVNAGCPDRETWNAIRE